MLRVESETCQAASCQLGSVVGEDEVNFAVKKIVHRMDPMNLGLYELQNGEQG